jgi:hypothetical protein
MRQAIDTATVSALQKGDIRQAARQRVALAEFNFRHADKEDEAMQLWTETYESAKDNKRTFFGLYLRTSCSENLADRYFSKVTNALDRGEPTDHWVSKLASNPECLKQLPCYLTMTQAMIRWAMKP